MSTEVIESDLLVASAVTDEEDVKKMATGLHGKINMRLGRYLDTYADENNFGHVLDSSVTYDFQDGLPKRQPDVSLISFVKLPLVPDQAITAIPDLAVETVSKNDTVYEIMQKIQQYQQAGVKLIWVVYPLAQKVAIYRLGSGQIAQEFGTSDELSGEDVLEGFTLRVSKIFERLDFTNE